MNTDEAKKQEIVDRLAWNNSLDANDVNVLVDGDTGRLEGTVPSYAAKITAENEAYLIDGITHVKKTFWRLLFHRKFSSGMMTRSSTISSRNTSGIHSSMLKT